MVDDDRTTRRLLALQLRRAGYSVSEAGDGQQALERVRRQPPDLVLLDVWMPGMDGLAVLARLRDEPRPPRVVMMTADDTSDTLLRAIRDQAYRYLAKPIEPAQLLEVVGTRSRPGRLRPIEVVSARPDWVEVLVPCQRESAQRLRDLLAHLDADLPEDVRSRVGQAFGELLMNAIEWGASSTRPRTCASRTCVRAGCCSTGSPTRARASASRASPMPRSPTRKTGPPST